MGITRRVGHRSSGVIRFSSSKTIYQISNISFSSFEISSEGVKSSRSGRLEWTVAATCPGIRRQCDSVAMVQRDSQSGRAAIPRHTVEHRSPASPSYRGQRNTRGRLDRRFFGCGDVGRSALQSRKRRPTGQARSRGQRQRTTQLRSGRVELPRDRDRTLHSTAAIPQTRRACAAAFAVRGSRAAPSVHRNAPGDDERVRRRSSTERHSLCADGVRRARRCGVRATEPDELGAHAARATLRCASRAARTTAA